MREKEIIKYQDVAFRVVFQSFEPALSITEREGALFLAFSSILVSDKEHWYEVPLKEISSIDIEKGGLKPKMWFKFENGTLEVTGNDRASALALRHFLLPLIGRHDALCEL
jgi:hypothetical protein